MSWHASRCRLVLHDTAIKGWLAQVWSSAHQSGGLPCQAEPQDWGQCQGGGCYMAGLGKSLKIQS